MIKLSSRISSGLSAPRGRLWACVLAAAFVFAAPGLGQTTTKIVDGVTIVKNGKKPVPPAGAAKKFALEPVFSVGGGDSPQEDFSLISSIAVSRDGSVFVLDAKECRIKAFDAKGRFLRSFGKKGQGPGEMNGPTGLLITPSGELLVEDMLNGRLAYFTLDGKFLRLQSTAQSGLLGLSGVMMDSRGRIAARTLSYASGTAGIALKTFDKDLKPGKTLSKVEISFQGGKKLDILASSMELVCGLDDRGHLFVGSSKGYLIRIFDLDGRLLRNIERDYDPIPVSKKEQNEKEKELARITAQAGFKFGMPEVYPPYKGFLVHPDGRLIVQTWEKGKTKGVQYYDLFDAEGRYILRFTTTMDILFWRGDRLYGQEENEDGFPVLKCFRIVN